MTGAGSFEDPTGPSLKGIVKEDISCLKRPSGRCCCTSCCRSRPWLLGTSLRAIHAKNLLLQTSATLPGGFFWLREHVSPEHWQAGNAGQLVSPKATLNQWQTGMGGGHTARLPLHRQWDQTKAYPPPPPAPRLSDFQAPTWEEAWRHSCYCLSSLPAPVFHSPVVLPGVPTSTGSQSRLPEDPILRQTPSSLLGISLTLWTLIILEPHPRVKSFDSVFRLPT